MHDPDDTAPRADEPTEATTVLARVGTTLERHRLAFQGSVDGAAWVFGIYFGMVLRYDLSPGPTGWGPFPVRIVALSMLIAVLLQVVGGRLSGLYHGRFRYGTFDEMAHLLRSVAVTTVLLAATNRLSPQQMLPTSVTVLAGLLALLLMGGARYLWRMLLDRSLRPNDEHAARTLVYGAGEGGVQVITSMLRNPSSPYVPVALLDDDPVKRSLRIMGVPVAGNRSSLAEAKERFDAGVIVIAIPSADTELLRELTDEAVAAHLDVLVLPPLNELLGSPIGVGDLRPVTEADLLGRHEIDIDIDAIAGYLAGRRVLVTGAGGSIGSELCRQITRFAPSELLMLDRDESALHGVQLVIEGRAMLDTPNLIVADLRDRDRIFAIFDENRPEVVFHAAALKHLPLLELHPSEALKTNVAGTQHVIDACLACGVDRFVNISTDKAADPTSVLGFTKRITERLTSAAAARSKGTFLSVRFGNVLGSRGSVLTTFHAQIDAGGPVTVTHPDVTRFFMTVEEAVQLVIQAGSVGSDGEALVLDMGKPVRIDDVARRLAAQAKRPIEVIYTGLRRGEKLHEKLLGEGETDRRPAHPLISHVSVPPLDFAEVMAGCAGVDGENLIIELQAFATCGATSPAARDGADGDAGGFTPKGVRRDQS